VFQIGDKVVYPVHGAGIIEAIETKEVLGEEHRYYVLFIPSSSMRVMIPCDSSTNNNIRSIVSEKVAEQVMEILHGQESQMSDKWSHRYRLNMDKIKSGDILELAEVVRNLSLRDVGKGLSSGEKRLLDQAKEILVSELALVRDAATAEVDTMLENIFQPSD